MSYCALNFGPSMPAVIRGVILSFVVLFILALPSNAQQAQQTYPRLQFFGGYSYLRFDSQSFGFANSSGLNGWNAAAAGNLLPGFGVIAELTGQYGAHFNLRDLSVGPQFLYPRGKYTFFAHGLYGKARTFIREGNGVGDTQKAFVLGGGVDMKFRSHFDIRIIQADYLRTTLLSRDQNSVRLSTGIVYHWGTIRPRGHRPPKPLSP